MSEFVLNFIDRIENGFPRGDVVTLGIDGKSCEPFVGFPGERVEAGEFFYLIAKKLHANGKTLRLCRENIQHISPDSESPSAQLDFVSGVLQLCKPRQDISLLRKRALPEVQNHAMV